MQTLQFIPLFLVLSLFTGYAQSLNNENLVSNADLESFSNGSYFPRFWENVSPIEQIMVFDNFHLTKKGETRSVSFSNFFVGKQKGKVTFLMGTSNGYCGFLQVKLKRPLKKGYKYKVGVHILATRYSEFAQGKLGTDYYASKLKPFSDYFLAEIPAILEKEPFYQLYGKQTRLSEQKIPYLSLTCKDKAILNDTATWMYVEATYLAKGGERYLGIGQVKGANAGLLREDIMFSGIKEEADEAFQTKIGTNTFKVMKLGAFYAYDDFELYELGDSTHEYIEPIIEKNQTKVATSDSLILQKQPLVAKENVTNIVIPEELEGIYFDFDKSSLLEKGFLTLDKIAEELAKCATCKVILYGHCDGQGSDAYNLNLSKKRCQAARNYLISKGIKPERIAYEGKGKQNPAVSNDTELGRSKNRWVEYKIVNE
ncbi:MAG: OmpA family protein [Bacteroidia bacterium]